MKRFKVQTADGHTLLLYYPTQEKAQESYPDATITEHTDQSHVEYIERMLTAANDCKRRNAKVLPFIFSGLTRRRASVWRCFPEISATECGTTCASINSGNPGHWSLQSLRPYLIRLRFVNSFFSRSRNTKCFVLAASSQSRKKSEALENSLLSLLREYVSASYS